MITPLIAPQLPPDLLQDSLGRPGKLKFATGLTVTGLAGGDQADFGDRQISLLGFTAVGFYPWNNYQVGFTPEAGGQGPLDLAPVLGINVSIDHDDQLEQIDLPHRQQNGSFAFTSFGLMHG